MLSFVDIIPDQRSRRRYEGIRIAGKLLLNDVPAPCDGHIKRKPTISRRGRSQMDLEVGNSLYTVEYPGDPIPKKLFDPIHFSAVNPGDGCWNRC